MKRQTRTETRVTNELQEFRARIVNVGMNHVYLVVYVCVCVFVWVASESSGSFHLLC